MDIVTLEQLARDDVMRSRLNEARAERRQYVADQVAEIGPLLLASAGGLIFIIGLLLRHGF